jgi:hypothetical protein
VLLQQRWRVYVVAPDARVTISRTLRDRRTDIRAQQRPTTRIMAPAP